MKGNGDLRIIVECLRSRFQRLHGPFCSVCANYTIYLTFFTTLAAYNPHILLPPIPDSTTPCRQTKPPFGPPTAPAQRTSIPPQIKSRTQPKQNKKSADFLRERERERGTADRSTSNDTCVIQRGVITYISLPSRLLWLRTKKVRGSKCDTKTMFNNIKKSLSGGTNGGGGYQT